MYRFNVEIKARCAEIPFVRNVLQSRGAIFRGTDHQIDTYFNVRHGRLKLREGNIEHALIHYERENRNDPKQSRVTMYNLEPGAGLKEVLTKALGVQVVVDKRREIYFIDTVKFHLDDVAQLGTFVEIEAIDEYGTIGTDRLTEQCKKYMEWFRIREEDLLAVSYSDLLLSILHPAESVSAI